MCRSDNLDELRGHALNVAVATELGWKQLSETTWQKPQSWRYVIKLDGDKQNYAMAFDPAHDIADAWVLDGEGWEFGSDECLQPIFDGNPFVAVSIYNTRNKQQQDCAVELSEVNSKAEAYATARCIAWLKARAAERKAE